jgi:hypothetical protein
MDGQDKTKTQKACFVFLSFHFFNPVNPVNPLIMFKWILFCPAPNRRHLIVNTHDIKSNRESGYGRYDIMVIPHDPPACLPGGMEHKILPGMDQGEYFFAIQPA